MKTYTWNSEKNELLKLERDISFEVIVLNIQLGNELDIYEHPNQERYPKQTAETLTKAYKKIDKFLKTAEPKMDEGKRKTEVKSNITDNGSQLLLHCLHTIHPCI